MYFNLPLFSCHSQNENSFGSMSSNTALLIWWPRFTTLPHYLSVKQRTHYLYGQPGLVGLLFNLFIPIVIVKIDSFSKCQYYKNKCRLIVSFQKATRDNQVRQKKWRRIYMYSGENKYLTPCRFWKFAHLQRNAWSIIVMSGLF